MICYTKERGRPEAASLPAPLCPAFRFRWLAGRLGGGSGGAGGGGDNGGGGGGQCGKRDRAATSMSGHKIARSRSLSRRRRRRHWRCLCAAGQRCSAANWAAETIIGQLVSPAGRKRAPSSLEVDHSELKASPQAQSCNCPPARQPARSQTSKQWAQLRRLKPLSPAPGRRLTGNARFCNDDDDC